MPRVAMKEGTRRTVVTRPLTRPTRRPKASSSSTTAGAVGVVVDEPGRDDDLSGHERADGQVEFPGDDHEVLTCGQQGDGSRPAEERQQGRRVEEMGFPDRDDQEENRQDRENGPDTPSSQHAGEGVRSRECRSGPHGYIPALRRSPVKRRA